MVKVAPGLFVFQQGVAVAFEGLDHGGALKAAGTFDCCFVLVQDGVGTGCTGVG